MFASGTPACASDKEILEYMKNKSIVILAPQSFIDEDVKEVNNRDVIQTLV